MDRRDESQERLLSSSGVDSDPLDGDEQDLSYQNNHWDDIEDIELASDEHDLFLHENFAKNADNIIVASSRALTSHKSIDMDLVKSRNRSQLASNATSISMDSDIDDVDCINPKNSQYSMKNLKSSHLATGDPSLGLPANQPYRMPNYQQFAAALAPTSSTSILISLLLILVIVSITVVPIILPQTNQDRFSDEQEEFYDVIYTDVKKNGESSLKPARFSKEHSDVRCKCICPPAIISQQKSNQTTNSGASNTTKLLSNTTLANKESMNSRRLYVGDTPPSQCNCNNIVQPHLLDTRIILKDFCTKCECRYQSRNTTTIKRNVIFFVTVLSSLSLYMFVQYLLKYFRVSRRSLPPYLRWLSYQASES